QHKPASSSTTNSEKPSIDSNNIKSKLGIMSEKTSSNTALNNYIESTDIEDPVKINIKKFKEEINEPPNTAISDKKNKYMENSVDIIVETFSNYNDNTRIKPNIENDVTFGEIT